MADTYIFDRHNPTPNTLASADQVRGNFNALATHHSTHPPTSPQTGYVWYDASDPTNVTLKAYRGATWVTLFEHLESVPVAGRKDNFTATVDPGVDDDLAHGYQAGSWWYRTDTGELSLCLDATTGAAVWQEVGGSGGGSGVHVAARDPLATDDGAHGFEIGNLWLNTVTTGTWQCLGIGVGAAVWVRTSICVTAADPGVSDDLAHGYRVGAQWLDSATGYTWICIDSTDGAAVWSELAKKTYAIAADPGVAADLAHGFEVGALWVNTSTRHLWVCIAATNGAAVWNELARTTNVAAADPTVASDLAHGYPTGSFWLNNTTRQTWICVDSTNGAAIWVRCNAGLASANDWMTASATAVDGDLACATAVALWPYGDLKVLINGGEVPVGDGAKDQFCYFSRDGGVTALAKSAITVGDLPYWVGSIANYQLTTIDRVTFLYQTV